ncbi:hypothetical protein [Mariniflexile sp. AS56]|uniref:hypothetical protein n=1 Tax=Mariniflexile sp. AS56 TaxID=3063957 RepID=UPI0026EA502C|nr:hypothetical protein [Mariniflexile sp. AS56]MDO7173906.1 hypothetical protein [Mariniflexile sp. AS56]
MSASLEMEALLNRIYLPTVFYFPHELFPNLSPETKKVLEEYHFFEELGVLKADGEVSSLNQGIHSLELFKKDTILESNLFELLETKERLKSQSFGVLLERYLLNVKAWIFAYKWLHENFSKQIPKDSDNYLPLFEYQSVVLEKHLTSLKQYFKFDDQGGLGSNELADVLLENKAVFPLNKTVVDDIVEASKGVKQLETLNPVKKQKKPLLLTNSQADDFLLKTVFNIRSE